MLSQDWSQQSSFLLGFAVASGDRKQVEAEIVLQLLSIKNLALLYYLPWYVSFETGAQIIPGWPQTFYVAEDKPELLVLLLLPSKCWDYRFESPSQV